MKTKLQILEEQIRKDLPRLMELGDGCWFENSLEDGVEQLVFIEEVGIGKLYYHLSYNNKIYKVKEIDDRYKIIGHDILLSDVLEWFDKLYKTNPIFFQDILYQTNEGYLEIWRGDKIVGKWDLSKLYLKDQSEELIEFLYNLIEK